jgi:hypothetical protein
MNYLFSFDILENVQQAKTFLVKKGIDPNDQSFIKLKTMVGNNVGYLYWLTKLHFEDEISLEELQRVWQIIKSEPQIISKFQKPVVQLKNIEEFWDEYLNKKNLNQAKSIYNEFPSEQKKFINLADSDDINLLNDLYRDKEKNIFLKKVSRYHNIQSLKQALKLFLYNKSENEFKDLLKSLQDNYVEVVYSNEENDIIIAVVNYKQILKFGADTSWCIVRSIGTFDGYNRFPLSQQFIIFLLDKKDIYSKIGVTTNLTNGYYTAHLKDDKHISKEKLTEILTSRGFDINSLYPTKENAIEFSWAYVDESILKDLGFTDDEILKKKRSDVFKLDWDNLSVDFLLQSGFSKEQIVKKKLLYNNHGQTPVFLNSKLSDLDNFTREEIEKYKLLEKTRLRITDLEKYSKSEIIQKKLFDRVREPVSVTNLPNLGFNFDEIKRIIKNPKIISDSFTLLSEPIITNIILNKTRRGIVKLIKSYYIDDVDYSIRDGVRKNLIDIIGLTEKDIEFETLLRAFDSHSLQKTELENCLIFFSKFYQLDFDKIKSLVSTIGPSFDDICKIIGRCNVNINSKIKPFEKNLIELIKSIISGKNFTAYSLVNSVEMLKIKEYLEKYPEVYQLLYDKIHNNLQDYVYEISKLRESQNLISVLVFWEAHKKFNIWNLTNVFNNFGLYRIDEALNYCKEYGYKFEGDEAYKFVKSTMNNDSSLEFLKVCIENSFSVDKCYEELFEKLSQRKSPFDDNDATIVREILLKRDDSQKRLEEFEKRQLDLEAIKKTEEAFGFKTKRVLLPTRLPQQSEFTMEDWYESYWKIVKKLNFKQAFIDNHLTGNFFSCVVGLLAKLKKLNELNEIDYNFIKQWHNTELKNLSRIVTKNYYENDYIVDFVSILNESELESIYDFLNKKVDEYCKNNPTASYVIKYMLPVWYVYDKKRLKIEIDKIKLVKKNYNSGYKLKVKYSTNRLDILTELFRYIAEKSDFKYLEEILSEFKWLKQEKRYLNYISTWLDNRDNRDRYRSLLNKYLSTQKNESFILSFDEFEN